MEALEKAWETAQLVKTSLNVQKKEQNLEFLELHFFENSEGTIFNFALSIFSLKDSRKQFGCSFILFWINTASYSS